MIAAVAIVIVETSAPKTCPRVALVSDRTISGSVVRTLRGGEGFQQRSVIGSKARKKDRISSFGNGFAIFRPGKPAIQLRFMAWYPENGSRTQSSVEE